MNSFYDQTAANLIDNITAKELGFLKAQKATMKDCAGDPREIAFTVVGMLLDMDIPPVKRGRLNTRNIPFFRQHATIVGLGTEKFEKATCIDRHIGHYTIVVLEAPDYRMSAVVRAKPIERDGDNAAQAHVCVKSCTREEDRAASPRGWHIALRIEKGKRASHQA
ncbi:hypothetical protein C8J57DRAFT_1241364 [Mycena rebaudengoi]|nr:hypothetical protein C8J57DRAFT_1241364 [Mycena rebaudengoi]